MALAQVDYSLVIMPSMQMCRAAGADGNMVHREYPWIRFYAVSENRIQRLVGHRFKQITLSPADSVKYMLHPMELQELRARQLMYFREMGVWLEL